MKPTKKQKMAYNVARRMASFYSLQNTPQDNKIVTNDAEFVKLCNEVYVKAQKQISDMKITGIEVSNKGWGKDAYLDITISLGRPGLLIGYKGKDYNALKDFLSEDFKKKVNIRLKEDDLAVHLTPINPADYMGEDW